jgi:putative serine protease PepD
VGTTAIESRGRRSRGPSRPVVALSAFALGIAGSAIGATLLDSRAASRSLTPTAERAATASPAGRQLDAVALYRRAAPGVVDLQATVVVDTAFGKRSGESEGSGFVFDTRGDIVTNEHVVEGASAVTVRFHSGLTARATVVGSDSSTDVAVIRVHVAAPHLHPLRLGDSSTVRPGESVVAIGSPFGLPGTITAGIVSAVGRTITAPDGTPIGGAIQTDAAINSGNSGGPLLDAAGKVIGVDAQINSRSGGYEGVGFAIPANTVRRIVAPLLGSGR